jgi:hypothetical protein
MTDNIKEVAAALWAINNTLGWIGFWLFMLLAFKNMGKK